MLESYSRVIESLAYTVLSRIEDVLEADSVACDPPPEHNLHMSKSPSRSKTNHQLELTSYDDDDDNETMQLVVATPTSVTLSDMMGWKVDKKDSKILRNISVEHRQVTEFGEEDGNGTAKPSSPFSFGSKVTAYLNLNPLRTPSSRH